MRYARYIETDEPIMMLDDEIGVDPETGEGIDGSRFAAELMQLDEMGKKRIQIWINSIGGGVIDGFNICNGILKTKTKVDTYCVGIAASMAGIIFQCGRKRIMTDYGILMYHNPYNADQSAENDPMLSAMKDSLNKIVAEKSGMDSQAVCLMMDRTTFINAEEAKTLNLCDEIETTAAQNAPRKTADAKAFWKSAKSVVNSLIDKQSSNKITINKMKLVLNALNLHDDASESSILKAIEGLQNKVKADGEELEKAKKSVQDAEDNLAKANEKLKAAEDEAEQLKGEKKAAEEAKASAEALALVKDFAKQGRIKNDDPTINAWVAKAKEDMPGVKAMLESLPLNKTAHTVEVEPNKIDGPATSAALLTAKVMNDLKKAKTAR